MASYLQGIASSQKIYDMSKLFIDKCNFWQLKNGRCSGRKATVKGSYTAEDEYMSIKIITTVIYNKDVAICTGFWLLHFSSDSQMILHHEGVSTNPDTWKPEIQYIFVL